MRWIVVCALLASACAANVGNPGDELITLRGRVVDAETCVATTGCEGLSAMVVALAEDPDRVYSQPTATDGTFVLAGVPAGFRQDLIVRASAGQQFAPTINPMVVRASDHEDRFGLVLYALPRDPDSLLAALRPMGIDLVLGGGYVGQAVREMGSMVTAADGAGVAAYPAPDGVRFVSVLPRYVSGEPVLRPADATTTGPFGLFIVPARGAVDPFAAVPIQDGLEYDLVVGSLQPGFVTFGIHRGR